MTDAADLILRPADLDDPQLRALLQEHIDDMYAVSPPESVHTLDFDALAAPDMRMVTAWLGDALVGCGALRLFLENGVPAGELKSMRTSAEARGHGVATRILAELVEISRAEGVAALYLETGVEPYFAPARAFYLKHGFVERGPFGDYEPDPLSVFMTRPL